MPQLDFSSFISQIFWLSVFLTIIFLMLNFFTIPNLKKIMNYRKDYVSGNIALAEAHKLESQKINDHCNEILNQARVRASAMMDEAENMLKKREEEEDKKLADYMKNEFSLMEKNALKFSEENFKKEIEEFKLKTTKLFVLNILEEDIEDKDLSEIIMEVENSMKLGKN